MKRKFFAFLIVILCFFTVLLSGCNDIFASDEEKALNRAHSDEFYSSLTKKEQADFDSKLKSIAGSDYYKNLDKKQKKVWWSYPIGWIKKLFKSKEKKKGGKGEFNPYYLSRKQDGVVNAMRDNILLKVDKKTGVITISVTAQDLLIAKSLTDSVRVKLQAFITDYRTNKARIDEKYYKKLVDEAKADYEKARRLYGSYADSNTDVMLVSFRAKQNDLENDMQLKYNTYTTLMTQYQASKAKVQERTPAFTLLKGASVPIKPSGPKRMLFVIGVLLLSIFGTAFWIVRKDLHLTF